MTKIIQFPNNKDYYFNNIYVESYDDLEKAFEEWYRVGKILNRVKFSMVVGFILLVGLFILHLS